MQKTLPFVTIAVIVLVLWLPFGFKTTGIYEEWAILDRLNSGQQLFFVGTDTPLRGHGLRPLTFAPFALGYALTPDSFVGYNVLQIVFFIGKGVVAYLILDALLSNRLFAFAAAILFMVHPADSGLFTLRGLAVHASILLYLISVYLLLVYWKNSRWWAILLALVCSISCLFIYEVFYPAVAFTPLLLVWLNRGFNKRVIRVSVVWYLAPLVTVVYSLIMLQLMEHDDVYQFAVLNIDTDSNFNLREIFRGAVFAYRRSLIDSWLGLRLSPLYLLLAAGLSALVFFVVRRFNVRVFSLREYSTLLLFGFITIFLGIAPYLVLSIYRYETWRTYYLASLGAAVFLTALVYLLSRGNRLIFSGVMSGIIGVALLHGFNQHGYYADLSLNQQHFLAQMVAKLPQIEGEKTILIINETGLFTDQWTLTLPQTLSSAFSYLYDNPNLKVIICYRPGMYTKTGNGRCPSVRDENTIVVNYTYEDELELVSGAPEVDSPPRKTPFTCWPIESCIPSLKDELPQSPVYLDFSFDEFITGTGWRAAEVSKGSTFRWAVKNRSTINVNLSDDRDYRISFAILPIPENEARLRINNVPIVLQKTGTLYEGVIPQSAVHEPVDRLLFIVDDMLWFAEDNELGFALDWLKIEPAK